MTRRQAFNSGQTDANTDVWLDQYGMIDYPIVPGPHPDTDPDPIESKRGLATQYPGGEDEPTGEMT